MKKTVCLCSCLMLAILMLVPAPLSLAAVEPEENFDNVFKITISETNFSEEPDCKYITCLGEIQNLTNEAWENLTVEVKYFDSKGALIDTETENLYSYVVPAGGAVSFRVRFAADRAASAYVSHSARVTWADKKAGYVSQDGPKRKTSVISSILISWTPMILLIGAWAFFMYWYYARKRSPQVKVIDLLQSQVVLLERQNQLFERLVKAVENYKKD